MVFLKQMPGKWNTLFWLWMLVGLLVWYSNKLYVVCFDSFLFYFVGKLSQIFHHFSSAPVSDLRWQLVRPGFVDVHPPLSIQMFEPPHLPLSDFNLCIFSQSVSLTQYVVLSVRLPACLSVPVSLLSKRPSSYCLIHFGGTSGAAPG